VIKVNDLPFRALRSRTAVWIVLRLQNRQLIDAMYSPSVRMEWRYAPFGIYVLNLHDHRNRTWAPVPLRINSLHFRRLSTWLKVKRRL